MAAPARAAQAAPHALHQGERVWQETNCYVDLWIELLHGFGLDPRAALRVHRHAGLRRRPVHVLQVPAGRPRAALRHPGAGTGDLRLARRPRARADLARPYGAGGSGRLLSAEHARHVVPARTSENHRRHRLHRSGRAAPRLFPQHRLSPARRRGLRRRVSQAAAVQRAGRSAVSVRRIRQAGAARARRHRARAKRRRNCCAPIWRAGRCAIPSRNGAPSFRSISTRCSHAARNFSICIRST